MSQEQFDCEVMQELEQAQHDTDLLDLLRQTLAYDPDTGVFTWAVTRRGRNGRSDAGQVAGGLQSAGGYRRISIGGQSYQAHTLAWLWVHGKFPQGDIDHINGQKDDNRIANLRDVSRSVNLQNMRKPRNTNTSGYLGVSLFKRTGKYTAEITINYQKKNLGYFSTAEEASAAYLKAKRELHEGCTL